VSPSVEAASRFTDLRTSEVSRDPYPVFAQIRRDSGVSFSEAHRAWLVTEHALVAAGYTAKQLSSDRIRPLMDRAESPGSSTARPVLEMMRDWMVVSDPPSHTRLRKVAAAAFKRQQIAIMGEQVTARVDSLIDDFIANGEQDIIEHIAHPLPGSIIAKLLGAPPSDQDRFREWSDELALVAFGAGGEAQDDRHSRALRGLEEMVDYFRGLMEAARRADDNSIMSVLLQPSPSGELLTDEEVLSMCALLLFAGHETTINSIANGVLALLQHPDQMAKLIADPSLMATAVEEMLRYDGPIKLVIRYVVDDLELGGQHIKAGERVYLVNAAANRDPAVFADPDVLDITRKPNSHLAFGRGVHACIGAQLARLEMRIAVEKIVVRLPGLALATSDVEWQPSLSSRSMRELRVSHAAPMSDRQPTSGPRSR
jgi:cytochrome P450